MRNYIGIAVAVAVGVAAAALALSAAGVIGDDSDDEPTTVVREVEVPAEEPPDTTTGADAPIETPSNQEPSGPCDASREPTPTRTGFADLEAVETSCEYAEQVATAFADAYGPDCFGGCTKLVEGIRCETQPPTHAEVVCFAARTEVRFTISGAD